MKPHSLWLFAVPGLLWLASPVEAAGPPPRPGPLKGVVLAGRAIACVRNTEVANAPAAWIQTLVGGPPVRVIEVAYAAVIPVRWHVRSGSLWVADASQDSGPWPEGLVMCEGIQRFELPDLFRGNRVIGPGSRPLEGLSGAMGGCVARPVEAARLLYDRKKYELEVYYDYLPTGRAASHLFVLTNVEVNREALREGLHWRTEESYPRGKLQWSFLAYRTTSEWLAKSDGWWSEDWTEEGSLDLSFREPFQALARGKDYYFLTDSGKLFRAPPPAKGKHRKVEKVWDDKRSPIVAQIQDADRGRTFLFCARGPRGKGGPFVFELGSGVRPRFYDPRMFNPGDQGPDNLRKVVGYARVLEGLGYLKVPKKVVPPKGGAR